MKTLMAFLKDSWEIPFVLIIVLMWCFSLWHVDNKRYSERNMYWENVIATAPAKIDTVYKIAEVKAKPIRGGTKPTESEWQARLDSVIRVAGEDVEKLRGELKHYTKPFTTQDDGVIEAVSDDPNIIVRIPYVLKIDSDILSRTHYYEFDVKPFKVPVREITIERLVLVEIGFWEKVQYYGTGFVVGAVTTVVILGVTQ